MKILYLLVLLSICFTFSNTYSTFNTRSPVEIKNQITSNDWNVYILYFFDSYSGKIDTQLSSHLNNNILKKYGDQVYYGEVDISDKRNLELLDLVHFYTGGNYIRRESTNQDDVPFLLLISHGYGWILQGDNAYAQVSQYMDAIISHAERSQTVE